MADRNVCPTQCHSWYSDAISRELNIAQIESLLKRRRIVRGVLAGLLVVLCGAVAIDQLRSSNDWRRFDRQTVAIVATDKADEIVIDGPTTVRLIGIDAPYDQSLEYTKARLKSGKATLRLEPTQTRDAEGKLLAYVYLSDNDCLNFAMIRDGKAFADRRVRHTFSPQYEQVETEARKKSRGIWKDLREADQPQWRREWLEQLRKDRAPTTRRS
jgi:endonuclease YncB( thermonuclease family)